MGELVAYTQVSQDAVQTVIIGLDGQTRYEAWQLADGSGNKEVASILLALTIAHCEQELERSQLGEPFATNDASGQSF